MIGRCIKSNYHKIMATIYHNDNYLILPGKVLQKHIKCCDGMPLDTRNSVCCQTDMSQRLIDKQTVFQDKCCHVNGHILLYDSIKQQCSYKGIIQKAKPMCMFEEYSPGKDLCCQERTYVKDGHMLNMSCCGHTPFFTTNQTCCNEKVQTSRY